MLGPFGPRKTRLSVNSPFMESADVLFVELPETLLLNRSIPKSPAPPTQDWKKEADPEGEESHPRPMAILIFMGSLLHNRHWQAFEIFNYFQLAFLFGSFNCVAHTSGLGKSPAWSEMIPPSLPDRLQRDLTIAMHFLVYLHFHAENEHYESTVKDL